MVNIKSKKCAEEGCQTRSRYNIPGQSTIYCSKHKLPGMVPYPTKQCQEQDCHNLAIYGTQKANWCFQHKDSDDHNLYEKKCSMCDLEFILNKDSLCSYCDPEVIARKEKKELRIKKLLDDKGLKYLSHDKIIPNGCNRRRPDFLFDCGSYYLCLEIDEFQHRAEQYSCECVRIFDIVNSLGMPVFFLRYNPDNFKKPSGRLARVSESKRYEILLKALENCLNIPLKSDEEFIRIRYLFYDGWLETDTAYELIPYKHN